MSRPSICQCLIALLLTAIGFASHARAATCDGALAPFDSTLAYYSAKAFEYASTRGSVSPQLLRRRELFIDLVQARTGRRRANLLEVGAGHGRDAVDFLLRGHAVVITEPSEGLARIAEAKTGERVYRLKAQDLTFRDEFDGVWAATSLIHVPHAELRQVLVNLVRGMKVGGVMHASFLAGVGTLDRPESLDDGRVFNRVSEAWLRAAIKEIPEASIIEAHTAYERDDYFGATAPSATFGFFNLVLRRVR